MKSILNEILKITIWCNEHGNVNVRTYRLKTFSIYEYNDSNQKTKTGCLYLLFRWSVTSCSFEVRKGQQKQSPLTRGPRSNMLVVFLVQTATNERTVQRPHASRLALSSHSKFSINLMRNRHRGEGWETGQEFALKPSEMEIIRHASSFGPACCNKQDCHFRRKSPQQSKLKESHYRPG